jgi:hypothetical protein
MQIEGLAIKTRKNHKVAVVIAIATMGVTALLQPAALLKVVQTKLL